MTPTEKALEIANAMYNGSVFDKTKEQHLLELENAKRCALIAVNEILNWVIVGTYDYESLNEFWQEVKQEIINL
jgi:hypothetical protein